MWKRTAPRPVRAPSLCPSRLDPHYVLRLSRRACSATLRPCYRRPHRRVASRRLILPMLLLLLVFCEKKGTLVWQVNTMGPTKMKPAARRARLNVGAVTLRGRGSTSPTSKPANCALDQKAVRCSEPAMFSRSAHPGEDYGGSVETRHGR